MRKTMQKEVTKTTVKVAKMGIDENGLPKAEQLPETILIGNVTLEKAQKEVAKLYQFPVVVFGVEATTETYEMNVEDFIKYATLKTEESETPQADAAPADAPPAA